MPGQQERAVYMLTLSNVVLVMIYCLRIVNNTEDKELRKKEEKSHTKLQWQYWSEKKLNAFRLFTISFSLRKHSAQFHWYQTAKI